jgi:hypothetical protein
VYRVVGFLLFVGGYGGWESGSATILGYIAAQGILKMDEIAY